MDDIDRKILDCVQHDTTLPVAEIAERVRITPAPCPLLRLSVLH